MATNRHYNKDGRATLSQLYNQYKRLVDLGWKRHLICSQGPKLPIYAYTSPISKKDKKSASFWILSGIHGEEPAGPNALAQSIEKVIQLAKNGIPAVFMPMLNPKGYFSDDRYFDSHRSPGSSIGDAEYLLRDSGKPNVYSQQILDFVVKLSKTFPPMLVMDHHEDEIETERTYIDSGCSYSYCYGEPALLEPLCKQITDQLIKSNFPVQEEGETRFGEKIHHGFVVNSPDGSIDELLSTLGAKAVFVIETTRDDNAPILLENRINAHAQIVRSYKDLWNSVTK